MNWKQTLKWYAGSLSPEDRLNDNGEQAEKALKMSLAERCYQWQHEDVECDLFEALRPIFGEELYDCGFDDYDSSVEIITNRDTSRITKEQADQVFALGFHGIYFNVPGHGCYDLNRKSAEPWHFNPIDKYPHSTRTGNDNILHRFQTKKRLNEAIELLKWIYNDGAGREVFPNNLDGSPSEKFEQIKKLIE